MITHFPATQTMSFSDNPDETSSRRPSSPAKKACIFYKLIVPSILEDKKLKIPGKFVRQFQDELAAVATLTLPNGQVWLVELKKEESKLWFDKGWHEFLKHLSIRVGYFLVFRYEGNSTFTVYVYDLTACEINFPCINNTISSSEGHNHLSVQNEKGIENNVSCDVLGPRCPCLTPSFLREKDLDGSIDEKPFSKANNIRVKVEDSMYEDFVENLHLTNNAGCLQATVRSTRDKGTQFEGNVLTELADRVEKHFSNEVTRTRRRKKRSEPDEHEFSVKQNMELGNSSIKIPLKKITRRWREVTTEEMKRAISAAETFNPVNPFFRVILRPSYVYRGFLLHIPVDFSRKYLRGVSAYITLQISEGKQWPALLIYADGGAKLTKGWPEFAWENYLEEGDVCVFEMIRTKDIVLIVTVFRVLEVAKPVIQTPNELLAMSDGS